ncbi:MAG: 3-oxoacyl-ACP reductase FabG [Bacteroidia bacterium]|nr:3-oxoacyl-ACP reductase FabG [Bacteroidia bacterium]MDW8159508.1 3-oxoacyl-ACP reductase FabG [Bacteroidia bacterium]
MSSSNYGRLQGKVAIITGGAAGIGKCAAEKFCSEGAIVIIWDVNYEAGEKTINELKAKGYTAEFFSLNVTQLSAVEAAAKSVVEKYGKIDILINNAGITRDKTLLKMTEEQWRQVIEVNLTGVFNTTKAVVPYMVEKGYGRIINTSSVVALYGNIGQTNYVATKAALIGMTKTWGKELGPKGITVNAVAPGYISTEMITTVPENIINEIKQKTPLRRLGTPEDVANAYLFLASDEASYVNATVLSVDGGMTI